MQSIAYTHARGNCAELVQNQFSVLGTNVRILWELICTTKITQ